MKNQQQKPGSWPGFDSDFTHSGHLLRPQIRRADEVNEQPRLTPLGYYAAVLRTWRLRS